jgi:hypothetical protein
MSTIHPTQNALRNHEELFPNHESELLKTDPQNGLAPGDPARMAARIIESVEVEPAPLRLVLGSQALEGTLATLRKRIANFETQTALEASTDIPPGT